MNYKNAYLHTFNRLTSIIQLLQSVDPNTEVVDIVMLLQQLQAEAEELCTRSKVAPFGGAAPAGEQICGAAPAGEQIL